MKYCAIFDVPEGCKIIECSAKIQNDETKNTRTVYNWSYSRISDGAMISKLHLKSFLRGLMEKNPEYSVPLLTVIGFAETCTEV